MNLDARHKITASHLSRQAYLYVRQSTLRQVLENTESTKRQYALRERAVALGWKPDQVVVIDRSPLAETPVPDWPPGTAPIKLPRRGSIAVREEALGVKSLRRSRCPFSAGVVEADVGVGGARERPAAVFVGR